MIRPRKMKRLELTILARDVDAVLEYLGRRSILHVDPQGLPGSAGGGAAGASPGAAASAPAPGASPQGAAAAAPASASAPPGAASGPSPKETLSRLRSAAAALDIKDLPEEPGENSRFPTEAEDALAGDFCDAVNAVLAEEAALGQEKRRVEEALNEARSFAGLNAPFADLDQLSYLTLRVGRLEPKAQGDLKESLAGRAVLIPLDSEGGDGRILAAASRKGRFALDSELKRLGFKPIAIPEGYKGIPGELLASLESRLSETSGALSCAAEKKSRLREEYASRLPELAASYLMADIAGNLKSRLRATKSVFLLSGWTPAALTPGLVQDLERLTGGRVAVRAYDPEEIPAVTSGAEKVPVSLQHGAFVKGFESVVFSYGAPLYGSIDPTPLVAVFFTLLFGIMFGDSGQGLVLFLLGLLTSRRGPKALSGLRSYSTPLISVGLASIVMGLFTGEVFTAEELLVAPTRAITGALTGKPVDRILTILPLAEKGGSVAELFAFFGFTIGVGVILNSSGLVVNIINLFTMKKYEKALFSKTGLAGAALFWYAVFIAVRAIAALAAGGMPGFYWYDFLGLLAPCFLIFFGPALWRFLSGQKPALPEGLLVFIMEGFVEVLETASTYVSNTVSFLRVGAFALSHGVLAYIVFRFSSQVSAAAGGPLFSLIILVFGNAVIILLEGMIVAIQVVRLQYYEFFSKFFTETGVEFVPFAFRKRIDRGV